MVKAWPVGVEPGQGIGTGLGRQHRGPIPAERQHGHRCDPLGRIGVEHGDSRRRAALHSVVALPRDRRARRCRQPGVSPLTRHFTAAFVATVGACAERLRATGIDPADYDISAIAADADDLRRALGLDRWWLLGTQGTMSRATFEYLRAYPDRAASRVRRLTVVPRRRRPHRRHQRHPRRPGRAVHRLRRRHRLPRRLPRPGPDLAAKRSTSWTRRRCTAPSRPLPATPSTSSSTPPSCCAPPASPSAATDRPTPASSRRRSPPPPNGEATPWLLATIAQDPIFCAGYRPFCIGQDGFSLGAYLTEFCRDQAPFIDDDALERGRRR